MQMVAAPKVSEMAENLIGSEILKLAALIKERLANGEKIYDFTIGDFDPEIFSLPTALTDLIIAAYTRKETNYPLSKGMPELRKSVANYLNNHGDFEFNKDEILIGSGARPLIFSAFEAIIDPGDGVIVPLPSWNNNHYTHISAGKPIYIETNVANNFMLNAEDIVDEVSDATLIALCSPLNPTGTTFSKEQLEAICDLVIEENQRRDGARKPLYVLYDQVYWQLTYGDTKHLHPIALRPEMKEYTIYIDGISKCFAATGVRVEWAMGPDQVLAKMGAIGSHMGSWAPKPEQVAVAEYLQEADTNMFLDHFKQELEKRLVRFYEGFKSLKDKGFNVDAVYPQAAIYLTVKIELIGMTTPSGAKLNDQKDVTSYLLDEGKIGLVPFSAFGTKDDSPWYRLSVGTSSLETIDSFFKDLSDLLMPLK